MTEVEKKDIKWTDAQIRFPEYDGVDADEHDNSDDDDEEEEERAPFDPFADPDPTEVFSFRFLNDEISLDIHGYKTDSDAVFESTGLTLWKASKYLCDYMVEHKEQLQGQRILELGAGLGLNGVLAHRLGADSVVITDGDSDAMVELRKNILVNRENDSGDVSAAQLIWGKESSLTFLEGLASSDINSNSSSEESQFSIIIASDVIYAAVVIEPLLETVRTLLRYPGGEFWMAFAVRRVPVTIDFVLEKAREYGFRYELVDAQDETDDSDDVERNPETGPVFVYILRWDETAECNRDKEIEG